MASANINNKRTYYKIAVHFITRKFDYVENTESCEHNTKHDKNIITTSMGSDNYSMSSFKIFVFVFVFCLNHMVHIWSLNQLIVIQISVILHVIWKDTTFFGQIINSTQSMLRRTFARKKILQQQQHLQQHQHQQQQRHIYHSYPYYVGGKGLLQVCVLSTHTCTHMQTHTHMHTYTHTCTHTHSHTLNEKGGTRTSDALFNKSLRRNLSRYFICSSVSEPTIQISKI